MNYSRRFVTSCDVGAMIQAKNLQILLQCPHRNVERSFSLQLRRLVDNAKLESRLAVADASWLMLFYWPVSWHWAMLRSDLSCISLEQCEGFESTFWKSFTPKVKSYLEISVTSTLKDSKPFSLMRLHFYRFLNTQGG